MDAHEPTGIRPAGRPLATRLPVPGERRCRRVGTGHRALAVLAFTALLLGLPVLTGAPTAAAASARIELRVLVVTDGSTEVEAVRETLARFGVPVTVVDLTAQGRPVIDAAFLAGNVSGKPDVHFQGVVTPDQAPPALAPAELAAIHDAQLLYGIRQLDASVKAGVPVGLYDPFDFRGYVGQYDGMTAQLTPEALAGDFADSRGPVPFEDPTPDVADSWVEIAPFLPGYHPFLVGQVPGTDRTGSLAGVLAVNGREEMSLNFSYTADSIQFQALAPGIVRWLTRGVHLGFERTYLAMHIDDILLPNTRWVMGTHCTASADCPQGTPAQPLIRMTPEDVDYLVEWQRRSGFRLTLAYNGFGAASAAPDGSDPLLGALVAAKDQFGWVSHTWSHMYLGCIRDWSVTPWRCATVPYLGWTRYVNESRISEEITRNLDFARQYGLPIDPAELVTGEHSGLRAPPQMTEDSPELADALDATGVRVVASDASEETTPRMVGDAATVPRYPLALDFDTATIPETIDQYNWRHTSVADGGAGTCDADASCRPPVATGTGFTEEIVPAEAGDVLEHMLANDPRPHYAHQPQLTEDRTLYPVLDRALGTYRSLFADSRPIITPTMTEAHTVLDEQGRWAAALAGGGVRAFLSDGVVTVETDRQVDVPVTVPPGTREAGGADFGTVYGAGRSGWLQVDGVRTLIPQTLPPLLGQPLGQVPA